MCNIPRVDVCVEYVSGYGFGESRSGVGHEYAGKMGYDNLSTDLPMA